MVGIALGTVSKAAADADDDHLRSVVDDVVANLLEATQGGEIDDRVGHDAPPRQGQPGRDAGHVLLGHANIEVAFGKLLGKRLEHRKPQIPRQ